MISDFNVPIIGLFLWSITGGSHFLFLIGMLVGIGMIVYFAITKQLVIGFSTADFIRVHGMSFEVRTADGKLITEEDLMRRIEYINLVILQTHRSSVLDTIAPYEEDDAEDYEPPKKVSIAVSIGEEDDDEPIAPAMTEVADEVLENISESVPEPETPAIEAVEPIAEVIVEEIEEAPVSEATAPDEAQPEAPADKSLDTMELIQVNLTSEGEDNGAAEVADLVRKAKAFYRMQQYQKAIDTALMAHRINADHLDAIGVVAASYNKMEDATSFKRYRQLWRQTSDRLNAQ